MMAKLPRRMLLSAALVAVPAADAVSKPQPPISLDAELIALCAEFNALDRQQRALYDGPASIEDEGECTAATRPIFARMEALLDCMEDARALTAEGIAARAGSLAQHSGDWDFSFDARDT